jgi:ABC-type lipoprotein export system ATPase subunit
MLDAVGLQGLGPRLPQQLSGGQLQRVAIARALVHRPAVLLADEPTGNLDSHTGDAILELLRGIAGRGTALVMATHSAEAAALAHRMVRMHDGRVTAVDEPVRR